MNNTARPFYTILLFLFCLPGTTWSADAPLGSPKFRPSPERPVGWRGDGTGRYPGATPPTIWERKKSDVGYTTKGILWMAPLPNKSVSSPIIVGERIFLTTEVADLVCLDKQTGRALWIRSNPEFAGLDEDVQKANPKHAEKIKLLLAQLPTTNAEAVVELKAQMATATADSHPLTPALTKKRELQKQIMLEQVAIDGRKNEYMLYGAQGVFGYSGPTPTSDGKRICVFFATGVAACYDLDGNRKWIVRGKWKCAEHGNFCSPVLIENRLVVWANEMRGYDVETGKLLWTNPASSGTYGSLFRLQAGDDLVAGFASGRFTRVRDGQPIWGDAAFGTGMPTPIVEGNTIIAYTDQNNKGCRIFKIPSTTKNSAVTPIATLKIDWTADELSEKNFARTWVASPLVVDGLIYSLTEGGGLLVNDSATGDLVYRKVLSMKPKTEYWNWAGASASPTLAGNYIYLMDNQGTTIVIERGRRYKEVAKNLLEDFSRDGGKSQTQTLSTPIFDGVRMYYRANNYLYCIGDR